MANVLVYNLTFISGVIVRPLAKPMFTMSHLFQVLLSGHMHGEFF